MNLSRIMADRGMNQVELAKRSGVSQGLISSYIRGGRAAKLPSIDNLRALSRALGCTPNDLLGWPEKKPLSDRTLAALEDLRKLPVDDPRRKAIEILLGIDMSIDQDRKEGN